MARRRTPSAGRSAYPNIISGNTSAGVVIRGTTAQTNTIGPNFIGTGPEASSPSGMAAMASRLGGRPQQSHRPCHVLSQGNVIRFNAQIGVRIESATQNAILNNRISDNGLLGIDLEGDGVTLNDSGDADTGANGRQNFPVLTSATDGVEGTLNSTPNTTFTVAFFGNTACDGSTHGEGATPLGSIFVTTDGTGNATIPFFAAAPGQSVTSTATSPANNTSEFSACVQPEGAVTRTWISDANGFWEDAANWSDGIVPQNGDQVVINRTSANPIVTIQSAVVTLASLQSQEPIVNIGGNLTFDGPAVLSGGLTMSGGQFGGVGDLALGGASVWTGGPIVGTGGMTVQIGGSLFVNTPGGFGVLGRSITNFGTLSWNQAGLAMNGGQILNAGIFRDPGQPLRFQRNHCQYWYAPQVWPGRDPSAHWCAIHFGGHAAAASRRGERWDRVRRNGIARRNARSTPRPRLHADQRAAIRPADFRDANWYSSPSSTATARPTRRATRPRA